ncbi:MAG TPA: acetyl-CoA carboxylase biotin carboxyl carrier protein [Planctomycetaceae bacterium]|nr:acetyl-CoA carboxylase biotin carboxyl carrier protein [Planctomycetaceae bacterium]
MTEKTDRPGEEQPDVFDVEQLRRFVELMEEHDLSEINLKEGGRKIRLRRGNILPAASAPAPAPVPPAASPQPAPSDSAPAAPSGDSENIAFIKSPMVGTFYSRPNPNAEPFVKVGDVVEPETTVCIIEAMKVFNEIPAELRGKIVAVLVKDEEPVEFGTPLFKVDTSAV